jgi:hypothetical protein
MERPITVVTRRSALLAIVGNLCVALFAVSAKAEAMRTWVSGAGDDMMMYSRTQPCRSFNRAIQETAAGGEINCLDPAEYGTFSLRIEKSITIDCEGTFGGVLGAADQAAINIFGDDVVVTLRNLTINGSGKRALVGVNFSGSVLRIDNCKIFGFRNGVVFAPTTVAKLFLSDSAISENDTGISIRPVPFGMQPIGRGGADVAVNKIIVQNNTNGILADGTFGRIKMAIKDSEVSGNTKNGIHAKTTNQTVRVTMYRTMSVNNDIGIVSEGANARITLDYSLITGNRVNLSNISGSGLMNSHRTNSIEGNPPVLLLDPR